MFLAGKLDCAAAAAGFLLLALCPSLPLLLELSLLCWGVLLLAAPSALLWLCRLWGVLATPLLLLLLLLALRCENAPREPLLLLLLSLC